MSELKLEQIGHPDAVSNSLTFDSDGTLATTTGFSSGGLKVKSSGGGTFSINPPSSASDRTLVLPDEAGTVLTTTSGVAKSGSTMTGALTIDTGTNGVPAINLNHSNTNADNFVIQLGTPGVSNAGFTIRDTDESANRFIIDNAGHITMPYQSAFHAVRSNTQSFSVNDTVIFNSEFYDQNGDYNPSTGVFTAPVTGKYFFSVTILIRDLSSTGAEFDLRLATSNRNYYGGHPGRNEYQAGPAWGDGYLSVGFNGLADMDAGDTAHVTFTTFGQGNIYGTSSGEWTRFSGFLVC